MLEEKRNVLRRALKREYIKQRFDPKHYGGQSGPQVFDAAFMRWNALQNSNDYMMKLNARTILLYVGIVIAPIYCLTKYTTYRRVRSKCTC